MPAPIPAELFEVTLQTKAGDAVFIVSVRPDMIAQKLGPRALMSKGDKASCLHGAVTVKLKDIRQKP